MTYEANNNQIWNEVVDEPGKEKFAGTPIQKFYAEERIFITGGTGFLGKVLLEKLLRSCPDISRIYLLIRSKKNKTAEQRTEELLQDQLYDRLKEEVKEFRDRIVTVNGDCGIKGLGLSEKDRNLLLADVTIVFHLAATVRFDEKLKNALATNVQSVADILDLCKRMPNLKSFVHVSTAYANCYAERINESFYDLPISFDELTVLAETLPEESLEGVISHVLRQWPNTYTFTKAIAEAVIREKCGDLPMGIYRPAVVTSAAYEPLAGWIDNHYGPTGLVAAGASGLLRIMLCDPNTAANIVPVDLSVNALIACAWEVSRQKERRGQEMLIYNFVSSVDAPLTWGNFGQTNLKWIKEYPLSQSIWYFTCTMIKNKMLYLVSIFFAHLLPALLFDIGTLCTGHKPRLWKLYGKVHKFSTVISHFCIHDWTFKNDNVRALWLRLNAKDQKLFGFSMRGFDWDKYFQNYVQGIRAYLFKDDVSTLPASRARANRLYWLHQIFKSLLLLVAGWITWKFLAAVLL